MAMQTQRYPNSPDIKKKKESLDAPVIRYQSKSTFSQSCYMDSGKAGMGASGMADSTLSNLTFYLN